MKPSLEFFLKNYLKGEPPSLDVSIHPKDEMYLVSRDRLGSDQAQMMYFKLGKDLSRTIAQIVDWRFTARRSSIRVMEFACGYGRNVRYLVHMFPKENIFVSDICGDAVSFNREQFWVRGRVSVHDPDQLRWSERFDLILVPSLFAHLPEKTFSRWIATLFRLLTDDGLLVFSVHGDHLLPSGFETPQSGIYFYNESESATLHKSEYGTSHVTERFVRDQIRGATGRDRYAVTRRGFWNFQDFYMVSKNDDVDLSSFQYDYGIIGYLDNVVVTPSGALKLIGWAKDTHQPDNAGLSVLAVVDGDEAGVTSTFVAREDVARGWDNGFLQTGYQIVIPQFYAKHRLDNTLVVDVVSSTHRECIHALPLDVSLTDNRAAPQPNPSTPMSVLLRRASKFLRTWKLGP